VLTEGVQNYGLSEWNNLSGFPRGTHLFGGVPFDLRGGIILSNEELPHEASDWFPGLTNSVNRVCRRIHLLATSYGHTIPTGTQVGKMVLHYSDGTTRERPIIQGDDVAHWRSFPQDPPLTGSAQLVATTANGLTAEGGGIFRLFKVTWENPLPDQKVESLELICQSRPGDLYVFAITLEQ
jgi:hypothetical protein